MTDEGRGSPGAPSAACQKFEENLLVHLEGEERPEVVAHARECAYCAVVLGDLEQVRFVSRHLPLEDPPASVWQNIRATLAVEGVIHEPETGWRRWLPRLVLVHEVQPVGALAALAALSLFLLLPPQGSEQSANSNWFPQTGNLAASAIYPGLDQDAARTLREMESHFEVRQAALAPTLRATYRQSLESLNASIEECIQHCQREPRNRLAREYLISAYQSKAEVLASALEFNGR